MVWTGSFGPPHHARANLTRRNPTVAACVETVATWWPSTKICADPCVGPTVVIQASVRTFPANVADAPFLVEKCSEPPSAEAVVWVLQAPA